MILCESKSLAAVSVRAHGCEVCAEATGNQLCICISHELNAPKRQKNMKSIVIIFACVFGFCALIHCAGSEEITKEIGIEENAIVVDNNKTSVSTTTAINRPSVRPKSSLQKKESPTIVCPGKEVTRPFFSLPCKVTKECSVLGKNLLCCASRCLKGVAPPKPEPVHSPTLFGFVGRACPVEPIPELWDIQECSADSDCGTRICCPEKMLDGAVVGFCRTAEPKFDRIPGARRFLEPLRTVMGYMQCTPPPPPLLDVFPKPCVNPFDCFPNLCCQERGKRFCRPPKRSLLALVTSVAQRIVPAQTARDFITRIS